MPAPFGPITATRWPRSTTSPASSSSGLSPARSVRCSASITMRPLRSTLEKPNASARSRRGASTLRHALDRLDLRLRLARARAGAELVDEALQPLDLGLLALEGVGLVRERHRLLAAVGAVAHRVVLAAPELELEDARRDALEEPAVVRDEQDRAGQGRELVLEPLQRAQVEVVRRLVEQQQVGLRRQHARERRARQLAARERAERPVGVLDLEAQAAQDLLEARAPRIAAHGLELGLRVRVGAQHVVARRRPTPCGARARAAGPRRRGRRPGPRRRRSRGCVRPQSAAAGRAARCGSSWACRRRRRRRRSRRQWCAGASSCPRRCGRSAPGARPAAAERRRRRRRRGRRSSCARPVTCRVGTPRGYPRRLLSL